MCEVCSPHKVKSYRSDRVVRLHRMCKVCMVESENIQRYIDNNHLAWDTDSDLVVIWMKKLGEQPSSHKATKSSLKINNSILSLASIWESFNFSFRELVGRVVEKAGSKDSFVEDCINYGFL